MHLDRILNGCIDSRVLLQAAADESTSVKAESRPMQPVWLRKHAAAADMMQVRLDYGATSASAPVCVHARATALPQGPL